MMLFPGAIDVGAGHAVTRIVDEPIDDDAVGRDVVAQLGDGPVRGKIAHDHVNPPAMLSGKLLGKGA
jgi:hypothetical protein